MVIYFDAYSWYVILSTIISWMEVGLQKCKMPGRKEIWFQNEDWLMMEGILHTTIS